MSEAESATKPAEAVAPAVEEKPLEQPEAAEMKGDEDEETRSGEETKNGEETGSNEEIKSGGETKSNEETKSNGEITKEAAEKEGGTSMLKTTAKIDRENLNNNRKFDPSTREVTDDPDAIRKQVEFYFGDWNFPQDKFMWETCGGSENMPMAIERIHSFKRMRCFQPYGAVVAALKDSKFLEVSGEEGKEEIKRKVPYKPVAAAKAKTEAATIYVKGFGDEKPDTQFELESFFGRFGEVNGLKLRRTNENLFKGSVFVTFADEETAKKFINQDPAPKWKDHDLKIMSKQDYCNEKSELIRQGKLAPGGTAQKKFYEGRDFLKKGSHGRGDRDNRGSRDPEDWKKRREQDQKNGFKDRRGGGRGRGTRGRGGRGGGRDGRRDRDADREQSKRVDAAATNAKRGRDDDDGGDGVGDAAPAAKRVDLKEE